MNNQALLYEITQETRNLRQIADAFNKIGQESVGARLNAPLSRIESYVGQMLGRLDPRIKVEGPETVFADDAAPLLKRMDELDRYGGAGRFITLARASLTRTLVLMEEALGAVR